MRIWDISPDKLCRSHLLGEHLELHCIWTIITKNRKGYSNHPETKRWEGKLAALYKRHEMLVEEMKRRNYNHKTNLDKKLAKGSKKQDVYINTIEEQIEILRNKECSCTI